MKTFAWLFLVSVTLLFSACNTVGEREYYQVKIFRIDNPQQESMLDSHFRDAYLPALHRAGISRVGVFKPIEGLNETEDFVMVLIPFQSLEQFEGLDEQLAEDETYQTDGSAYIQAPHDQPPYARIESFLLRSFRSMPHYAVPELGNPPGERVYELRSYESATELLYERKVEMFNDAGEVELFKKLEFNPLLFAEVLSSAHMPHLMYMITFADTTSQQEHWNAFGAHPDWIEMRDMERYANTVSRITRYLMHPVGYSDL